MALDHKLRDAILHGRSAGDLRNLAVGNGMQTLEGVAINKVRSGITTLEEMHRVLIVGT
jgi:type II secretory ATPase GspE/PulE/Tfp pilus assembly ATPase PilB-like protein